MIDDVKKKPRRRRNKEEEEEEVKPAEPEGPSELEKAKAGALSLFEEDERRKESKENRAKSKKVAEIKGSSEDILPPISLLRAEAERPRKRPEPAKEEPVVVDLVEGGEEEAPEAEDSEETPENVIHLKPPIIVKDLAEALGLKPFKVIQDLIAFEVFATPDKSVEPDIAEKICEKHGFVFEKERREKGGGVHKVEEVVEEPAPPEEEKEDEMALRPPIITPASNTASPNRRKPSAVPTGVCHSRLSISGSVMPVMSPVSLAPLNMKDKIAAAIPRQANPAAKVRVSRSLNMSVAKTVPAAVKTPRYSANFATIAAIPQTSSIAIER